MKIFEVDRSYIKEFGSIERAIKEGYYTEWNEKNIKEGFNFGNGTIKDFKNYMNNNKNICVYKEIN